MFYKKGERMGKSYYDQNARYELIKNLVSRFGSIVSREKILEFTETNKMPNPHFLISNRDCRTGKDYDLSYFLKSGEQVTYYEEDMKDRDLEMAPALAPVVTLRQKKLVTEVDNLIPASYEDYVPFGFYKQLEKVVKSKMFYPVFITGLSGNGKTTMVH